MSKYLFTFTLRADGSSLFEESKRWGYFPAVGFAWKMKDESFLKDSKTFNDLKLRLGYGITGQQDISGYLIHIHIFLFLRQQVFLVPTSWCKWLLCFTI